MDAIAQFDAIAYLVNRKYPYAKIQKGGSLSCYGSTDSEKLDREITAKAYKNELRLKTKNEIEIMVATEKAKENLEKQKKADKVERERFFHQPEAMAEFEYWAKMPYWKIEEAIALILGKNPEVVSWKTIHEEAERYKKHLGFYPTSHFVAKYSKIRELASRAVRLKQLTDPIQPADFLSWVLDNEITAMPEELFRQVQVRKVHLKDNKSLRAELEKNILEISNLKNKLESLDAKIKSLEQENSMLTATNEKLSINQEDIEGGSIQDIRTADCYTEEIRLTLLASITHWIKVDRSNKDSWPETAVITKWLTDRGLPKSTADFICSQIRPNFARDGRRK